MEASGSRWKSVEVTVNSENCGKLWKAVGAPEVGGLLWKIVEACETCGSRWNSIGLYGSS